MLRSSLLKQKQRKMPLKKIQSQLLKVHKLIKVAHIVHKKRRQNLIHQPERHRKNMSYRSGCQKGKSLNQSKSRSQSRSQSPRKRLYQRMIHQHGKKQFYRSGSQRVSLNQSKSRSQNQRKRLQKNMIHQHENQQFYRSGSQRRKSSGSQRKRLNQSKSKSKSKNLILASHSHSRPLFQSLFLFPNLSLTLSRNF